MALSGNELGVKEVLAVLGGIFGLVERFLFWSILVVVVGRMLPGLCGVRCCCAVVLLRSVVCVVGLLCGT